MLIQWETRAQRSGTSIFVSSLRTEENVRRATGVIFTEIKSETTVCDW